MPRARLLVVDNLTPFAHFQCRKMGPGRRYHDTVVVKGSFALEEGVLEMLGPGRIAYADDYWDLANAPRSSVKQAGDVVLTKPATDVIVTGKARAPGGEPARQWDVAVVVRGRDGALVACELEVTGPRRFEHRALRGWSLTAPEPTAEVPIRYELAYGGAYRDRHAKTEEWIVHDANPSGGGFLDPEALDTDRTYPAPQWQLPSDPITEPNRPAALAGLGPLSRAWEARTRYVGTCDDAWERRMRDEVGRGLPVDYAADFDPRFFQCAYPTLVARHLRGDEQLGLRGLVGGASDFLTRLPGISVRAIVGGRPDARERVLPLDTVHVDLDDSKVHLSWRLTLDHADDAGVAVLYMQHERSAHG